MIKLSEYINYILNNPANFTFKYVGYNEYEGWTLYYHIKYRNQFGLCIKVVNPDNTQNSKVYDVLTQSEIEDYKDINWKLLNKYCKNQNNIL